MKTVSEKMGVQPGFRAVFVNAPADAIEAIDLPPLTIETDFESQFDYIHVFVKDQAELHKTFPTAKEHLKPTGMLWVSWPKGRRQGTDLTLTKVIEIGYDYGLVESKTLSVNSTWSAIKFTYPKAGKTYNNKYGTLK